jgi:hypothetical protein
LNGSKTGIREEASGSEDSGIGGSGLVINLLPPLGEVHMEDGGDFISKLHSLTVPMGDMGAATGMATFW